MRTTTLHLLIGITSLGFVAGTVHAGSKDTVQPQTMDVPGAKASVPTVAPTGPKVKLGDDTMKALQAPQAPGATEIQKQQVAPKDVPESITRPDVGTGMPTSAPQVTTTPPPETIQKPQLDSRQMQQIRQLQEAAAAAAAMRQIDPNMRNRAGALPDTTGGDPDAATNKLGDRGPEMNKNDYDKLIRDLTLGRGGPASTNPSDYIGRSGSSGPSLNRGAGSGAAAVGAPTPDGSAESGPKGGRNFDIWRDGDAQLTRSVGRTYSSTDTFTSQHGTETVTTGVDLTNGSMDYQISTVTLNDGSQKTVTTGTTTDGSTIRIVTITDPDGNETTSTKVTPPPSVEQGAPTDNETNPQQGDCSPTSNWGCKKGRDNPMDMVTQPVHGDAVANVRGTSTKPSAGPGAVTNPGTHDGSSGRGGGGGGGTPGEGAVDPKEIIPGPLPSPGGTGAVRAAPVSDEALDAAMGGLKK